MQGWELDFINNQLGDDIDTRCALNKCCECFDDSNNIYSMIINHSYNEVVSLGILNNEQIQIFDLLYSEIVDDEEEGKDDFDKIKDLLSGTNIYIINGHCCGDTGNPVLGIYQEEETNNWVIEEPIERSNRVRKHTFSSYEDIYNYLDKVYRY